MLELATEDGSPIRNFPGPDENRLLALPGLLIVGAADADATLIEFFDYNCGYCREAGSGLDELLRSDRKLRVVVRPQPDPVGRVGPGGAGARERVARSMAPGGPTSCTSVCSRCPVASTMSQRSISRARWGWIETRLVRAMAGPDGRRASARQMQFAADAGLRITPTFVIAGVGFVGWPGVATMSRFLAAARRCGALRCS